MIHNDEEDKIKIAGPGNIWEVQYSPDSVAGPLEFTYQDQPFLQSCMSTVDDLSESLALAGGVRAYRKGKAAILSASGRLPFGTCVGFQYTHRYSASAMKVVKDIRIPGRTTLRDRLAVDSVSLFGTFTEWRAITCDDLQADWKPLSEGSHVWDEHPLSLIFRRQDGLELEIGLGNDIWRWKNGLLGTENSGSFELDVTPGVLKFNRFPTIVTEETSIKPRFYRYTWYMGWDNPAKRQDNTFADRPKIELSWRPNGDVAMKALSKALEENPDGIIEFDVRKLPWPENLLQDKSELPCLAANNVVKRLKRVLRQLAGFEPKDIPIRFVGLIPGLCTTGRHVDRKEAHLHWDAASILDFGLWARQCFGNDRVLLNDTSEFDSPAMRSIFDVSDHDEDAVHYEFVPPTE